MDPYADCPTPSLTNSDVSSSSSDYLSFEDRPLPPLPKHSGKFVDFVPQPRPFLTLPPAKPSAPLVKSKAWRKMHRNAVLTLRRPRILAILTRFIAWDDLYALFATCSGIRHLWDLQDIRDVILSRYLPGYRASLRYRDLSSLQAVDVTLHDLRLLCSFFPSLPTCMLISLRSQIPSIFTTSPASPVSYACSRLFLKTSRSQRQYDPSSDNSFGYPC